MMESSLVHWEVEPQRLCSGSQKWLCVGKPTMRSGKLRHTTKAKSTWRATGDSVSGLQGPVGGGLSPPCLPPEVSPGLGDTGTAGTAPCQPRVLPGSAWGSPQLHGARDHGARGLTSLVERLLCSSRLSTASVRMAAEGKKRSLGCGGE